MADTDTTPILPAVIVVVSTMVVVIMIETIEFSTQASIFTNPVIVTLGMIISIVVSFVFVGGALLVLLTLLGWDGVDKVRDRGCDCRWITLTGNSEIVEKEEHWERDTEGAKVIWRRVQTPLRRCTKCGRHFYTRKPGFEERREAWPEEEPEIMPETDELFGQECDFKMQRESYPDGDQDG